MVAIQEYKYFNSNHILHQFTFFTTMWRTRQVVLNNREGRRLESIYTCREIPELHVTYALLESYAAAFHKFLRKRTNVLRPGEILDHQREHPALPLSVGTSFCAARQHCTRVRFHIHKLHRFTGSHIPACNRYSSNLSNGADNGTVLNRHRQGYAHRTHALLQS